MPPELARIVERLLAKDPADRYPSVEEALADLRALRGEPATDHLARRRAAAGRPGPAVGLGRWPPWRSRPWSAAVYLRPRAGGSRRGAGAGDASPG